MNKILQDYGLTDMKDIQVIEALVKRLETAQSGEEKKAVVKGAEPLLPFMNVMVAASAHDTKVVNDLIVARRDVQAERQRAEDANKKYAELAQMRRTENTTLLKAYESLENVSQRGAGLGARLEEGVRTSMKRTADELATPVAAPAVPAPATSAMPPINEAKRPATEAMMFVNTLARDHTAVLDINGVQQKYIESWDGLFK
jgi:hypothetical protein